MEPGLKTLCLGLLLALPLQAATIEEAVHAAQTATPFAHALLMIDVEDDEGRVLFALNAGSLMIPASVRKLFAAAAVSQCFAPDRQFRTELWLDGSDLVLRGDGDPSFGSARYGYDHRSTFASFIEALRRRGIVRVRDVVADVSYFDRLTVPYQWKMGNLTRSDAAPVDALVYDENAVRGQAVASGGYFAADNFRRALQQAGITVEGTLRLQTEPRAWSEKLAAVSSPFLQELMATVLKDSQNLYAETLYKGIAAGEKPASYERAREIEARFLTGEIGIDPGEFRFVDGSGLASDDLVTPAAVVKLLRWMNAPQRRTFWWSVMAQPGGEGTLRRRLLPFSDRMRAKTGTVAGVNSLAGMVRGRDGRFRYFAVAFNHHLGERATTLLDAIVEAVADF